MKRRSAAVALTLMLAGCPESNPQPPPVVPVATSEVEPPPPRRTDPIAKPARPARAVLAERGNEDGGWANMLFAGGRLFALTEVNKWKGRMYVPASILWSVSDDGGPRARMIDLEGLATLAADDAWLYVAVYRDLSTMNSTPANVPTGRIFRMPLNGGPPVGLATSVAPHTLAVDGDTLYFDDWRMAKDGTRPPTPSGIKDAIRFAFDDKSVYFAVAKGAGRTSGQILQMPKTGGTPKVIATGLPAEPGGLAVDGAHVYFTAISYSGKEAETGGLVGRVPKEGGPVQALAEGQPALHDLWVSGEHVYFYSGRRGFPGTVLRVGKTGGGVETVTTDPTLEQVTVGPSAIYLASDGTFDEGTKRRVTPAVLVRIAR